MLWAGQGDGYMAADRGGGGGEAAVDLAGEAQDLRVEAAAASRRKERTGRGVTGVPTNV